MSDSLDLDGAPTRRSTSMPRATRRSSRQEVPEEFKDPETGQAITRKSRKGIGGTNAFDVPEKFRKRGWDYQWFTITVLGDKEDASVFVDIADGGWRAVRPEEMDGFMPGDYDGKTIDRRGQRLYTRPMHLTLEAREEDQQRAREVRRQKFAQAQMGDPNSDGGSQAARAHAKIDMGYERPPTLEAEEVF